MTPSPIKRHNPTFVRSPIWIFLRKIAGSAARMRSDMTERTVDICGQNTKLAQLLPEGQLTALRKDDGFDLVTGQTHSVDAHIPIRSERSADSEEQKDAHGGE